MANISIDIYDEEKKQDKVIFQQSKLPLSCEFNLFQDIYKYRGINFTQLSVNNNYLGDSFKVVTSNNSDEIIIKAGIFYHLGRPLELTSDFTITGLTTPNANRTDIVFVEWYIEEISGYIDDVLNFETSRQYRINFEFKVNPGSEIPNPTLGYNFFPLAKLNRTVSSYVTSNMIQDERDKVVYNFVVDGCLVSDFGGLDISISEGSAFVANTDFEIEEDTPILSLSPSSSSYVYINSSGYVDFDTSEPLDYHVMLAEVATDSTSIVSITDRRIFIPISWKYKYENLNGDTGFPSVTQKYKAGENLSKYDLVYLDTPKTVKKASATGLLPAIGIATQNFSFGEIGDFLVLGEIENNSWSWTSGEILYLDTISGNLIQDYTPNFSIGNYVQRVGVAISPTLIYFQADLFYIKVSVLTTSTLILNLDGSLENTDVIKELKADRLSWLAAVEKTPNRTFEIVAGKFYRNDTELVDFGGQVIDLGPSGNFESSPIPSNWYNKAAFTIDDLSTVQMYESVSNASSGFVDDPEIPDNETPVAIILFQDDGSSGPGTITPISSGSINDIRGFQNLGSIDNTAFKPKFRDLNNFIIQKGDVWFENSYLTLSTNLTVSGDVSSDTSYYIYFDFDSATGVINSSNFVTLTDDLNSVNLRKFIPLGKYDVLGGNIQRNSFTSYASKFWHNRSLKIEDTFVTPILGQSVFNTSFNFVASDDLDIRIGGFKVFEFNDYVKSPPNVVTFNYTVKKNSEVRIKKI